MCRYGQITYKDHYACFACRKTFKRRVLRDIDRNKVMADSTPATCPECQGLMADMGKDFKSPPKDDTKAWRHLRDLYSVGITYHSCGCSGPGYVPADKPALITYLEIKLADYVAEQHFWLTRCEPQTRREADADRRANWSRFWTLPKEQQEQKSVGNSEAVAFWKERLETLTAQLAGLKAA
ncbi:FmdB family zinc ribbon protein [Hymenobacter actinosclerus]|uniref:Uncharacterized protein n=1 Tax=Hymenobacter actinosclerus TaxID=82805 RepID=A0A1I0I5I5_9BACT|nr:hypothetical protein [Hymenobacter actinosclerus]SET91563.1 hypothetical protein SAMN04487998_3140 [Hymenobacter actinosclerus]